MLEEIVSICQMQEHFSLLHLLDDFKTPHGILLVCLFQSCLGILRSRIVLTEDMGALD